MKRLAMIASSVFLAVYCFYTIGGVMLGTLHLQAGIFFPLLAIGASLAVLGYSAPKWMFWICVGLNATLLLGACGIILLTNPPLWWALIFGLGLIGGTTVLNILTLVQHGR